MTIELLQRYEKLLIKSIYYFKIAPPHLKSDARSEFYKHFSEVNKIRKEMGIKPIPITLLTDQVKEDGVIYLPSYS